MHTAISYRGVFVVNNAQYAQGRPRSPAGTGHPSAPFFLVVGLALAPVPLLFWVNCEEPCGFREAYYRALQWGTLQYQRGLQFLFLPLHPLVKEGSLGEKRVLRRIMGDRVDLYRTPSNV